MKNAESLFIRSVCSNSFFFTNSVAFDLYSGQDCVKEILKRGSHFLCVVKIVMLAVLCVPAISIGQFKLDLYNLYGMPSKAKSKVSNLVDFADVWGRGGRPSKLEIHVWSAS